MTKKKNVLMRSAGLLLVLVLVTSCFVGSTFAKYVTSGGGTDEARVAKFGVKVTASSDMFAQEYATDDQGVVGTISESVVSAANPGEQKRDKLVAPGTKKNDALTVSVTGTPEVAVEVKYEAHVTFSADHNNAEGNWKDANKNYYCPLVITVNGTRFNGLDYESTTDFKNAIEAAINGLTEKYPANTDLSNSASKAVKISWEWPFENSTGAKGNQTDVNDTYLGDQAAAGNAATVGIMVTTTVTQID